MNDGSLNHLWQLLAPYKRRVIGLSLLIALAALLGQLAPQFVRIVIDELIPRGEARLFLLFGLGVLLFYVLEEIIAYASMYFSFAFTQEVISDVRLRAYGALLKLPMTRFTNERSGSFVSRVVNDVNALESMIQAGASRIVGQLFSIVVVLAILFWMNWALALVSLVSVALMAYFTLSFQGSLRRLARKLRKQVGEMTSVATEAVANMEVVKVFASGDSEFARFKTENDAYKGFGLERRKYQGLLQMSNSLSSSFGTTAVLVLGGWLIASQTDGQRGPLALTTGELTAFLLYLRNFFAPVRFIMNFNSILQSGMAALERVRDLLDDAPEAEGEADVSGGAAIIFENVTFTYPGAEFPALSGFSASIREGETVALVGPSGAGKTTVTKLLSRLYDPQAGRVLLGGRDLRDFRLDALRETIAHVPQDPTLFSGSVLENIRYAKSEASLAEVEHAADLANAANFITDLPQGFDTQIGERGVKLSGGQKQRIAIARAILKEAKILVLDEATSSLDSESETLIQEALDDLFGRGGVTSIVIAHRLSTIQGANRILVLDAGSVAEEGSHAALLSRDGLYRNLYDLQFREDVELVG